MNKYCKTSGSTKEKELPVISIKYLGKEVSQVLQINPIGTFARAPGGTAGLAIIMGNDKAVIPFTVKRPSGMSDNDFAIFALNVASSIICKSNGDVEINGNSDNVISYTGFDTVIQDLVTKINTEFTAVKAAVQSYVQTPVASVTTDAKVEKIKIGI